MTDSVERFSNRVANYLKYRPVYPPEVLEHFRSDMGLTSAAAMADIGSGTGISSKLFLENGNVVYGIEPNAAMRAAAEEYLKEFDNFKSVDGTAENTMLPDNSVDFVIAAQAFHWFDPERTRREFVRILKTDGFIALLWNERRLDATAFLREYERLLLKFAKDYEKVRHENVNEEVLSLFFDKKFYRKTFPNRQVLDFEGLRGRLLSASYMPSETDEIYGPMIEELQSLFAKYSENGRIEILYDTNLFYTQV